MSNILQKGGSQIWNKTQLSYVPDQLLKQRTSFLFLTTSASFIAHPMCWTKQESGGGGGGAMYACWMQFCHFFSFTIWLCNLLILAFWHVFSLDLHPDSHTKTVSWGTSHLHSLGGWVPTQVSVVSANGVIDIVSRILLFMWTKYRRGRQHTFHCCGLKLFAGRARCLLWRSADLWMLFHISDRGEGLMLWQSQKKNAEEMV